jgi:hypothetical protein
MIGASVVSPLVPRPVRTRLTPEAVTTANTTTTSLSLDGGAERPLSKEELASRLATIDAGVAHVRLRYERADGAVAERSFDLRFLIPREPELDLVDEAFAETIAPRTTANDLDRFSDRVAGLASAAPYASALHEYLRGILQKDRRLRGTGLEFSKHQELLNRALQEIAFYPDRPLARAVSGVIRFNLNVIPLPLPSGIPELDSCANHLSALARGDAGPAAEASRPVAVEGGVCPVDDATHALLQLFGDLIQPDRRRAAMTALLRLAASPLTTPADSAKARALALGTTGELTDDERRRTAAALANDSVFARLGTGAFDA